MKMNRSWILKKRINLMCYISAENNLSDLERKKKKKEK